MKKIYILVFALLFTLTACNSTITSTNNENTSPQFEQEQETHTPSEGDTQNLQQPITENADGVHVDLTQMNSTMVYAQVYDMLMNPQNYEGKTIKMEGAYYTEESAETGIVYHMLVILDATGCCPQGIEFITTQDAQYPDVKAKYPDTSETVQVTGVYETYEENGLLYFRIVSNDVNIVT